MWDSNLQICLHCRGGRCFSRIVLIVRGFETSWFELRGDHCASKKAMHSGLRKRIIFIGFTWRRVQEQRAVLSEFPFVFRHCQFQEGIWMRRVFLFRSHCAPHSRFIDCLEFPLYACCWSFKCCVDSIRKEGAKVGATFSFWPQKRHEQKAIQPHS